MADAGDHKPLMSRCERVAAGIFFGIFLLVAVGTAIYGVFVLLEAAAEILVAVITGSASILAGVSAVYFQRAKEVELVAIQRQRELELERIRVTMDHYSRILAKLALFIRKPREHGDDFTTAHLYTWMAGSEDVVQKGAAFLESQAAEDLDSLLKAMRQDVGLATSQLHRLSTASLFGEKEAPGHLKTKSG